MFINFQFKCCGTSGPSYWTNSTPESCYKNKDKKEELFKDGCTDKFIEFLQKCVQVIGITVLALSATEVRYNALDFP